MPVGQAAVLAAAGIPFHFYTPALQEALTNAFKHAGGAPTRVLVRLTERELELEIVNAAGRADRTASGAGRGLPGMKQRVAVYGGEWEAGPRGDGGFAVRARFPLELT